MKVIKFFVLLCVLSCCAALSALAATGDYYLDVTNGSGSGFYAAGTNVNVVANAAPAGKVFDKWAGSISYVIDIYNPSTRITVPQSDIVLIATYKTAPVTKYTLTVSGGTGSGTYAVGTEVGISANAPAAGKAFDQWSGDIGFVTNFNASSTTIIIPEGNVNVVALYKTVAQPKYTLTVESGTGSGSYAAGTEVKISANSPSYGKVFDQWTGDIGLVYDFYAPSTKITIPEGSVNLTATYRNNNAVVYTLSVNNGTGSGTYYLGEKVTVKANTPPSGKVFDKWTGDTGSASSTTAATIVVTIPDHGISLTATYKAAPAPTPVPAPKPSPAPVPNNADGTLIKTATSTKVYVIISGKKKWISTPEVFEQLGYQWTSIGILSDAELDKIPDFEDNLIRQSGDAKVFLVTNGIKRHIPNPNIFLDYGFDWGDVKDVDKSVVDKYKSAVLIRASKEASVYFLKDGIRKLIPTLEIFNSYGDNMADVQIISKLEMESYIVTNLVRLTGSNDIYLIQGDTKKKIYSAAVFNRYNFNWDYVVNINQTELNYYRDGGYLK